MKKKILTLIAVIIMISMSVQSASAFGGYTHWMIGYLKSVEDISKTEKQRNAYMSGCLLADIGEGIYSNKKLDALLGFDSDEYTFVEKIYQLGTKDSNSYAKMFSYGWRDHYIQDHKGDVFNMLPPYNKNVEYERQVAKGWADEYLRDKLKLDNPIQNNDLSKIYIDYSMIITAYDNLSNGGIKLNSLNIQSAIKSLFQQYDLLIGFNVLGWNSAQEAAIENEIVRVSKFCYGMIAKPTEKLNSTRSSVMEVSSEHTEVFATESDLKELDNYSTIIETPISDTEAYLQYVVTNPEKYYGKLMNMQQKRMSVMYGGDLIES